MQLLGIVFKLSLHALVFKRVFSLSKTEIGRTDNNNENRVDGHTSKKV